jgi:hypothetical protein
MDYDPDPFMDPFDDERVCLDCLHDAGLKKTFHRSETKATAQCSFCQQADIQTVEALEIQNLIKGRCLSDKVEAVQELSYCTAEGGYLGRTYEPHDVLELAMMAVGDKFYQAMEERLDVGNLFCDRDHNLLPPETQWRYGWAGFVQTVKHGSRFFFEAANDEPADYDPDEISPGDFLRHNIPLGVQRLNAVKTLPAGTEVFRCRITSPSEPVTEFSHIGPPPSSDSIGSNRFSPPGIAMFYAGETPDISATEIGWISTTATPSKVLHTGKFRTLSDLKILDLTHLAYPAGEFDPDWIEAYHIAAFFKEFIADLTAPIQDNRKHLDYVPTQIICEYFRIHGATIAETHHKLDGIKYPSSHDGTPCYVFFWDRLQASAKLHLEQLTRTPAG